MSRRLLSLTIPAIIVIVFPNIAPSQKIAERNKDVLTHERFCVTIWPEKTQLKEGEPFDVKLRVANSSKEVQSLTVWSCSFPSQWGCSNPLIGNKEWMCFSNYLMTVKLKPGEVYEKALAMKVIEKGKAKTESFKLGFTPHGEKSTYWSNEVVVGVE